MIKTNGKMPLKQSHQICKGHNAGYILDTFPLRNPNVRKDLAVDCRLCEGLGFEMGYFRVNVSPCAVFDRLSGENLLTFLRIASSNVLRLGMKP